MLNEISRSSGSSDSPEFILVEDDAFVNNDRNISNQATNHSIRSLPEEEIIKTRGRKKTKCSPFLRDLSPRTLVTIKSPIKNSRNEDLLKFLRFVNVNVRLNFVNELSALFFAKSISLPFNQVTDSKKV